MLWEIGYTQTIVKELNDLSNPSTIALLSCGQDLYQDLRLSAEHLVTGTALASTCMKLQSLVDIAYTNMSSVPAPSLMTGWMRLHTDACILRSLADIGESTAIHSLVTLDHALIMSGATGEGRLDLVLSIIAKIQHTYFPVRSFELKPVSPIFQEDVIIPTSQCDIPSLLEVPHLFTFQRKLFDNPFILRGYASDWPALQEHPWSSAEYLLSVSGPGRVVPVEVGKDYRTHDWKQTLMSWDDFIASLDFPDQPRARKDPKVLYLAQHSLLTQFPALRGDIIIPDYVYASLPLVPGYHPPGNDEQLVINVWLGPKGTVSPAHRDPFYNLFVQVVGRKTVWLAPATMTPHMYNYHGSSTADHAPNPSVNTINPSLSNTSRVDVFASDTTDWGDFPNFWEYVFPNAMSATLGPGDLIFIPPGWWHAMRSEETSFSVSLWF